MWIDGRSTLKENLIESGVSVWTVFIWQGTRDTVMFFTFHEMHAHSSANELLLL
jgi:hypothetical protein